MAVQCSAGGTYLSSYPGTNMPNTNSAITLMGWINYSGWTTTNTASMFGVYNGTATASTAPTTAIQIGARTAAGQLYAWTWGGVTLVNTTAGSPTLSNGVWYHVAYTCTAISGGTQTHSLYVNGSLAASATNASQVAATLTQVYINGYPQTAGGTGESSAVIVDDISFYNRTLTASEIQTAYATRGFRDGNTYGLLGRYLMQESVSGAVSSCLDYSSQVNKLNTGAGTALTYTQSYSFHNTKQHF